MAAVGAAEANVCGASEEKGEARETTMTGNYISDDRDDRNDGLSKETAIYSWQRAVKLCDAASETYLMQGVATLNGAAEKCEAAATGTIETLRP